MASFFDKESRFETDAKLIKTNAAAMRKTRITQAEVALQNLQNDINLRTQKLQEVYYFLDAQKTRYIQLTQHYEKAPDDVALVAQLDKLKPAIERLEAKLIQSTPEKIIADLSAKYEELKLSLGQKTH